MTKLTAPLFTFAESLTNKMNLIEELRWRGMIQDIMPGTEEQLQKEMTTAYIGFDPTAESLHIGSLVPILLLVHLQKAGHKPIALVGGAPGMVGDPSGKSEERNLLSEEVLQRNVAGVKKQLEQYLDFNTSKPNAAEMANNYNWFRDFSFLDFIRDVGKHITVNYMMAKESVKKRLEGETGMSFTEFTYQLVQGYDFFYLYTHKNCKLQMGGSDQWGNIVTGTELIRRKAGGEAFAFTCPLITKADGSKFGKSEKGNIWLDASKTSPYEFYQFWLNTSDQDANRYIKIFTFLSQEQVNEILEQHTGNEYQRSLQKKLAEEVTSFVHGKDALAKAIQATDLLFSKDTLQIIATLSENHLDEVLSGVPAIEIGKEKITSENPDIVTFLAGAAVFPSKSEARKMVQGGGVSLNKQKVSDVSAKVELSSFIHNKYLFVQKGKTNYYLIKAV